MFMYYYAVSDFDVVTNRNIVRYNSVMPIFNAAADFRGL